jgi:cyclophilin family peptidyl-prolyl cis-trans isomerase
MKHWLGFCAIWAGLLGSAGAQTNGIFADFATSLGDFTVWLDHERAPRAVASFVGLATGATGWLDPQGNVWHRPFYDGSLFHRIATNAAGEHLAIQGGGIAYGGITFTNVPTGPADSDGYAFSAITTNPPGVTTNDFIHGLVPFYTENMAAVPTNYVYAGTTVETNAAAVTFTRIQLQAWSSNATQYVVNTYQNDSWYTNWTLQSVETTNWGTIYTVTTNTGASPEVLLHRVTLSMVTTSTIRAPVVGTNFANAGYYALDSATNGLLHTNGAISMANSGPNTDGSQFFLMGTNNPYWDGSYTVFGHVVAGMDVVTSLVAVALPSNSDRPVQDVVLSNVVVRRVGEAAENFDVAAQGLPVVDFAGVRVAATGGQARVRVEIPPYSETKFRVSTNGLQSWSLENWGYASNAEFQVVQVATDLHAAAFFHGATVTYPAAWTAPTSHVGRTFLFAWNTVPTTYYRASFTNSPGIWEKTQGTNYLSGGIFGFPYASSWLTFPYSAKLYFADNLAQYQYSLWFDPGKATNRFTGTVVWWMGGGDAISGTFTTE